MTNKPGRRSLPLGGADPKNTVDLREALEALKNRPDLFADDAEEQTLDVAALEIGLELRRARMRKGWKQEQLASETGIAQSAISAIERGRGKDGPNYRTIRDLARALDAELVLKFLHPVSAMECRVVSESPQQLDFEEGFEDSLHCWALVRTLLQADAYTKVRTTMERALTDLPAEDFFSAEAICGLWRLVPRSEARMTAAIPMFVISTSHSTGVYSPKGLLAGGFYAMGVGEISLSNKTANPIGILTVPLTPHIALRGRRAEHVDY
jgi:transcriptional regulator with XRE-family HTH domain